ncbi:hypothetical protein RQP46_009650 [Phenoliferia psychrophenolica]
MAPKRKAANPPAAAEPAPKRSTRSSVASTSVAAPPAPAPAKKAAAPRKKKQEVVELTSSDADDMIVEEPRPKVKKAPAPKKAAAATAPAAVKPAPAVKPPPAAKKDKVKPVVEKKKPAVKSASKAAAPVSVASTSASASGSNSIDQGYGSGGQGLPSTSTTPLPEVPKPVKSKPKSPRKPVSWEQGLKDWFAEYADPDDPNKIAGDGIERMFEEMDVSMDGALPFVLAYKVRAQPGTFGSYHFDDFQSHFREPKVNSNATLKAYLTAAEKALFSSASTPDYREFYKFVWTYVKEEGQKSLAGEMASALWGIVLAPKYKLAKSFVEYTTSLGANFKGVSSDVWTQLLEFVESTDENLADYNEMDAWPSVIDAFVEWKQAKAT